MFIGLVGKPSAGKSTFFRALTLMDVACASYPFTTIQPNEGVGFVKVDCVDAELGKQCVPREGYCVQHKRFVPVKVVDVAGLVPGAHEGKGLGLEFLNDLSQADALIHIVDVSGSLNERGEPVAPGSYDPAKDIEFLEHELDMWYLDIFRKAWRHFTRTVYLTKENIVTAIARQFSGLRVNEDMVEVQLTKLGLIDKTVTLWADDELAALTRALRRETKPMLIAANKMDVPGADVKLRELKERFPHLLIMPCSAESELVLKGASNKGLISYIPGEKEFTVPDAGKLSAEQRGALEFIRTRVLGPFGSTGVQETLNAAVFTLLGYIAVFPGAVNDLMDDEGRTLPDCFLMPPRTTALDFAFKLHTDLGEHFIRAVNVKTRMPIKKDRILAHRDVIEIVHD